MWISVVFLQGEEADEVLDKLLRFDGVVTLQGATEESITEAVEYLKQWDYGDDVPATKGPSWGSADDTVEHDGYVLAWNHHLSYISLNKEVAAA